MQLDRNNHGPSIISLGPEACPGPRSEGGDAGGEIVAAGTPEKIAATKKSYTGQFLAPVLSRGSKGRKKGQVAAE